MTQVTHTDKHGDVSVHYEPPKHASGEWTAEWVKIHAAHPQWLADAHNAALHAERERREDELIMERAKYNAAHTEIKDLKEQLAAERAKVQGLEKTLDLIGEILGVK